MIFNWYNLFLLSDFVSTGLVQRTITVSLEGIGEKEILITAGGFVSILYEGTFLPLQFLDANPYTRDNLGIYLDTDGYVWLGVAVET